MRSLRTDGASSRASFRGVHVTSPRTMPRAVELAATAVGLGVAGHMLGGGSVSPAVLVPAFVPLLILARFCARKELSTTVIALTLSLGQSWVHMLASLTGHGQAMNGTSMLCGHALATVVALLILRRREALAWTTTRSQAIAAYVSTLLGLGVALTVSTSLPVHPRSLRSEIDPISQLFTGSVTRRGPPSGISA